MMKLKTKLRIGQVALLVACLSLPFAFAANASNDSHEHDASSENADGFAEDESFDFLVGLVPNAAAEGLLELGFQKVHDSKVADATTSIWYDSISQECVEMIVGDNKAKSIVTLESHDACK